MLQTLWDITIGTGQKTESDHDLRQLLWNILVILIVDMAKYSGHYCHLLFLITCVALLQLFLKYAKRLNISTAQKIKFSVKDFFSKCDKPVISFAFGQIYWRNPWWETSSIVQRRLQTFRTFDWMDISFWKVNLVNKSIK